MATVISDLKDILMEKSGIEQFGKDFTKYNIRTGSSTTFRSLYTGIVSMFAKNFGNGYAYRFADSAFRGAPKTLVEECSEKYRKLVPDESKRVVRNIKDLGRRFVIITHDVNSLCSGVYDELGVSIEEVRGNDFIFHRGRVSGIDNDQYGRPRVHDKAHTLKEYMLGKGYKIEDIVLIGHGIEEISMAHLVKNRIIVPERGSCKKLRESAMRTYEDLESLPDMISSIFKK